jgi:hypothetical protein
MHPLLPRVGTFAEPNPVPSEERRVIRRGAPEALRIVPVSPGWPPMRIDPVQPPAPSGGWGWLRAIWPGRQPGAHPVR